MVTRSAERDKYAGAPNAAVAVAAVAVAVVAARWTGPAAISSEAHKTCEEWPRKARVGWEL